MEIYLILLFDRVQKRVRIQKIKDTLLSILYFFSWHLPQHPHRVTSGVNRPYAAVIWLTVPRVRWTMKGDGEQEETQSNGRRSKAYGATMFLTDGVTGSSPV